ncbi:hypothetical protein [Sulfurimonas sp. HSL3-7]|uniref:hypothetical protein n=1 Tax=Sulfonitrofixus jiaomeiensis TaxID=3131938 RepID=UPI0031F9DECD
MRSLLVALMIILLTGCAGLQSPKETNIAVSSLLNEIQIAINEINTQTTGTALPPFKQAEIVLSTKAEMKNEGSASLVLSADGTKSNAESNTLTLVLTPNTSQTKSVRPGTGLQLAQYVVAAVRAIEHDNYLELQKLVVETGFNVSTDKSGGIEIKISSLSLGGKVTSSSSDAHILKLIFEKLPEKKL